MRIRDYQAVGLDSLWEWRVIFAHTVKITPGLRRMLCDECENPPKDGGIWHDEDGKPLRPFAYNCQEGCSGCFLADL